MSHSAILIQASPLSLTSITSGSYRKQRRNIACCCPWSSSEPNEQIQLAGQAPKKRFENASLPENLKSDVEKGYVRKGNTVGNKLRFSIPPFLSPMEFSFPFSFISILLSVSFFSLIIKAWKDLNRAERHTTRLPPGPPKIPIIGHMHHILSSLPHHYPLRDLAKKHGPLMHLKFGEVNAIIVSSPDLAKEVLKTHDLSCADRPRSVATDILWYNATDVLFSPYGDYWRQMRKICVLELLSSKNVRSFEYIRKDEGSGLIDSIKSTCGETFDLSEKIFWFMNSMTSRAAFGNVPMDRDAAIKLIKNGIAMSGHFDLADIFPSMKIFNYISWKKLAVAKVRKKLDVILNNVIDVHQEKLTQTRKGSGELGTEDLVDVLLRLKDNGELDFPITKDNIKSVIFDMFSGGTDTSSTTVDWAMAELMKNPHVMAKAQAEVREAFNGGKAIEESEIHTLKYLKLVIKETLRLHPPASIIPRACREEFEIDGYQISPKTFVLVNIWAIGRDPRYWDNPESFEPERFEAKDIDFLGSHFEYIPFGSGRRICPGMAFGVANVEYLLAQLLYHFDWKLPKGIKLEDIDMTEIDGFVISRKNGLCLIAEPYV